MGKLFCFVQFYLQILKIEKPKTGNDAFVHKWKSGIEKKSALCSFCGFAVGIFKWLGRHVLPRKKEKKTSFSFFFFSRQKVKWESLWWCAALTCTSASSAVGARMLELWGSAFSLVFINDERLNILSITCLMDITNYSFCKRLPKKEKCIPCCVDLAWIEMLSPSSFSCIWIEWTNPNFNKYKSVSED